MPIVIRETDVEKLLTMDDALKLVEDAFLELGRGTAENRPRQRVRVPGGVLNVMAAGLPSDGYVGYKAYTSFGGKARFWFHLFDAKSGEYLAVFEADRLGQMRTGAASGVATMYLARADAQTAGIVGAGWQAESQLEAVCAVRKLRVVRCFSRDEDHRRSFAAKMQARLGIVVQPAASARDAVFDSDIVITVTTSTKPVIEGQWLMPGTHINAAGGNWANRREIDDNVVSRASSIFVDSLEQAKIESGDLISPVTDDVIKWDSVQELGDLVAGKVTGRVSLNDITLYKSHGIALEDVAVAGWVYQRARAEKIGEPLPM